MGMWFLISLPIPGSQKAFPAHPFNFDELFLHWFLKFGTKLSYLLKYYIFLEKNGKHAKNLKGVFAQVKVGRWCLKILLNKCNDICFLNILCKHPLILKKCIQSLKKGIFAIFSNFY